jgi:hypothetical protein
MDFCYIFISGYNIGLSIFLFQINLEIINKLVLVYKSLIIVGEKTEEKNNSLVILVSLFLVNIHPNF